MRLRRLFAGTAFLAAGVLAVQLPQFAQEKVQAPPSAQTIGTAKLIDASQAFLETLSDEQRQQTVFPYETEKRVQWHFIPMESRKGLPLMQMQPEQKKSAMSLLQAAVSQLGYEKATTIMQLEGVLKKLEGEGGRNERNPEKYYVSIFGEPSDGSNWGLSFEGHHLSLNFVMKGNAIVDSTPQFFATNPASLQDDYGDNFPKGLRVLKEEEEYAFELVNSLDEQQLSKAMLDGDVPSEIRGAGEPQPTTEAARGIAVADLTRDQQAILTKLIDTYAYKMKSAVAKERWDLIRKAGFDNVKFAWSGAKEPGIGHYYCVQGPTFVIEFINVQPDAAGNPANHIHCCWRDMQGDFDLPIASN